MRLGRRACPPLNNQNVPGIILFAGIQTVIAKTEDDALQRALYISNTNCKEHNYVMAFKGSEHIRAK